MILGLCVVAGLACASARGAGVATRPAADGKLIRVFILAGQSNAGGAGNGEELPAALKVTDAEVVLYGRGQKGELRPLAPYPRVKEKFGIDGTAFGPELVFAKEMKRAFPGDVICVVKQSVGNCSIVAWDKDWRRADWKADLAAARNEQKEPNYDALLAAVAEGVRQSKEMFHSDRVEYGAMLWVQSERDDTSERVARMYEANLRGLIANVRADLKEPGLPFLFADANVRRFGDVIRAGMRRVAAEAPGVRCVSIEGLGRNGVHYDTAGQLELGKRFAAAYLAAREGRPAAAMGPAGAR